LREFTYCNLIYYKLYTQNTKTTAFYRLLVKSANQYLQLLVGSTNFLIEK
jgi:hypothetical protein